MESSSAMRPRLENPGNNGFDLFEYKKFEIFKDQLLGSGAYGTVYKATCDQLPCAVKVFFDPPKFGKPSEKKFQQFQQECEIMRRASHPNIVQYLGVRNVDTRELQLFMELLDENLHFFLAHFDDPLPYHLEVNLTHDICLAIAYLHSNDIIHRDLSSSNILIMDGKRAKVADFGMAKIFNKCKATPLTSCPGIVHYMSPEAKKHRLSYSKCLDCFSIGVLTLQICTRQHPNPSSSRISVSDERSVTGRVDIPVPETERRQEHLELVRDDHPFKKIIIKCLAYKPNERPTASELCGEIAELKRAEKYISSNTMDSKSQAQPNESSLQKDDLKSCQETVKSMKSDLQDKQRHIESMEDKIKSLEKQCHENQATIKSLRSDLQEKQNHIESVEGSYFKIKLEELEVEYDYLKQRIKTMQIEQFGTLEWREESIPFRYHELSRGTVITNGNHVYFFTRSVSYVYDTKRKEWNTSFTCPIYSRCVALVYGHLTIFGKKDIHWYCDQKWMKLPDCMPDRSNASNDTVALTSKYIIINDYSSIYIHAKYATHNDFRTESWRRVRLKICPNIEEIIIFKNMMHVRSQCQWWKCLVKHFDNERWLPVCAPPLNFSTYVTVGERILSIGGQDCIHNEGISGDVYLYDPCFDSWSKISEIKKPRSHSLVAFLPATKELMVVGGEYDHKSQNDKYCEVATIITI